MNPTQESSDKNEAINKVQLEGLVVMKIIKHCESNYPLTVAGQLLGMDVDDTLEITNCYAFPQLDMQASGTDATAAIVAEDGTIVGQQAPLDLEELQSQYQMDMMRCVREVNVDYQLVGWYQSCGSQMGSFITAAWVETQYSYQMALGENVVCITYDPAKAQEGTLAMRAYRLTKEFMNLYTKGSFSSFAFKKNSVFQSNMIEEIPIQTHNSSLIDALLVDFESNLNITGPNSVDYSRLDMSARRPPMLEVGIDYLISDIDELIKEQSKYSFFLRNFVRMNSQQLEALRKKSGETKNQGGKRSAVSGGTQFDEQQWSSLLASEPSRLDSKMLLREIDNFIKNIKNMATENMLRQSAINAVQAEIED